MKKTILIVIMALIIALALAVVTGCDSKGNIIGSWDHSGFVYTFNNDGTGSYNAAGTEIAFTYEDDGTKVSILYEGNTATGDYEYRIEGNKLIIKDSFGTDVEYIKK